MSCYITDLATVRLSQIKAGGTLQGFLKAVEAHKAWYRANGITDNDIVAARVLAKDEKTGQPTSKYSEAEVMSFHLRPPAASRTPNKNDAAWQAFIKQYRDNSDLKLEYWACIPRFQHRSRTAGARSTKLSLPLDDVGDPVVNASRVGA